MPDSEHENNRKVSITLSLILGIALIVRIAWIFWMPALVLSDFGWYYDRALSILAGHGYAIAGHPTAQFPPGYPFFLALLLKITGGVTGVKLAQAVIGTFTCYLVYRLALVLADKRVALVAAFIAAVYPNFIFYTNLLASENLFIPLLLGGLIILLDDELTLKPPARTAIAGAIFGVAALTRPAILFIPAILIIWLIIKRTGPLKAIGLTALMVAVMAAIILPWTIRNSVVMDSPILISSNGGVVFWMSNSKYSDGGRYYPSGNIVERQKTEVERSNIGYKLAIADIREDPDRFGRIVKLKYRRFFRAPDGLGWNILDGRDRDWTKENLESPFFIRPIHGFNGPVYDFWRRGLAILEYMLWIAGGLGALILLRQRRASLLMVLLIYVYWFVFHLVFAFGHPRFIMPIVAFNLILTAALLVKTFNMLKEEYSAWLSPTLSILVAPAVIAGWAYGIAGFISYLMPTPNNDMDRITSIVFGVSLILATLILASQIWRKVEAP